MTGSAELLKEPEKRAAAINSARATVARLGQAITDWRKKPPEEQLDDGLRLGGKMMSHGTTAVLLGGGTRLAAEGLGLAETALKGAEAEAALAKATQKSKKVAETIEHHAERKALPPAHEPRGLLPGRPAPVQPPEPGRFIVDPKGNVLIEPKGGSTHGSLDGTFSETRYANGSVAYQVHGPHLKRNVKEPHGHHLEQAVDAKTEGASLDTVGNRVHFKSPEAHWEIKK